MRRLDSATTTTLPQPSSSSASSSATPASAALAPFPTVERRIQESTDLWARDLRSLFEHAKDRYADVSWETDAGERIWAHKAVVYVRAPKAFKDRYFLVRKTMSRSPTAFSSGPPPYPIASLYPSTSSARNTPSPSLFPLPPRRGGSTLSVDTIESDGTLRAPTLSTGSADGSSLRLGLEDTPELFRAQLEWLYTGEGFGDVVEWISDAEGGAGSVRDSLGRRGSLGDRRDKLGQDLTYMWTSKLYCDVRIHLEAPDEERYDSDGSEDSDDSLANTVIFTAHRFMLVSRSPYFAAMFLNGSGFRPPTSDVHLPSPPFTPAALHFCLGWMYAGHLDFSNRTFDLQTAFQIHRAGTYLQLDSLVAEIEARIVHDFCHGLDWNKCHCRRCNVRAARVWRFALAPDTASLDLARRARRYLLAGWAESWSREVATADQEDREGLLNDVMSDVTPANVVSTYRSVEHVRARMEKTVRIKGSTDGEWLDVLGDMAAQIETKARSVLSTQLAAVCDGKEFEDIVTGVGFSDDLLDHVLREIVACASGPRGSVQAPRMYQTIVSSILLRVDPNTLETMLKARSLQRQKVEDAKEGVLAHIKRRWMQIREEGGFTGLEPWALKEIRDEIEVPIEDLLGPPQVAFPRTRRGTMPRTTSRPAGLSDAGSVASSARTPRTSDASLASRTSTLRSPPIEPPEPQAPEPNGLRRLRLSSSASTSSVVSARSAASRTASAASRPPMPSGPTPRSPGAAQKTLVVSVGSKGRAASRAATTGAQSPTPTRPGQVMTGGPRPLSLTGRTPVSKLQSAARSESPSSPLSPTRSGSPSTSASTRLRDQSVSSATSAASASSARTTAGTAKSVSSRPSSATSASRPSSATRPPSTTKPSSVAGGPKPATTKTTGTISSAAPKQPVKPVPAPAAATAPAKTPTTVNERVAAAAARRRTLSTASAKATKPANGPAPAVPAQPVRPAVAAVRQRTLSTASTKSTRSRAPSLAPSLASETSTAATSTEAAPAPGPKAAARPAPISTKAPLAGSKTPTPGTPRAGVKPSVSTKSLSAADRPLRHQASTKSLSGRPTPAGINTAKAAAAAGTPRTPTVPKTPTATTSRAPAGTKTPTPRDRNGSGAKTPTPRTPKPRDVGLAKAPPLPTASPRTRSTSMNLKATPPGNSPRQRTASSAAPPWKRATPLPPSVAGVVGAKQPPSATGPRPSLRSLSGSTEGPVTPRLSEIIEPVIVVDESSPHNTPVITASPDPAKVTEALELARELAPQSPESEVLRTPEQPQVPEAAAPAETEAPKAPEPAHVPAIVKQPPRTDVEQLAPSPPASSVGAAPEARTAPVPIPSTPGQDIPPAAVTSPALSTSPVSVASRIVSEGGTSAHLGSPFRPHPALAFDPPKKKTSIPVAPVAPKIEINDGNMPFSGPGVSLQVGIPCIVTLSQRRARFRANVKYLGRMANSRGAWVGLEVDDLERLGVETLPTGAHDGVRYFHFTAPAALPTAGDQNHPDKRALRQRRIANIAESLPGRQGSRGLRQPSAVAALALGGLAPPPSDPRRSSSPFAASEWAAPERPRALFVRPSEVVFVMGAD